MKLFNTMSMKKEEFIPQGAGQNLYVRMRPHRV